MVKRRSRARTSGILIRKKQKRLVKKINQRRSLITSALKRLDTMEKNINRIKVRRRR